MNKKQRRSLSRRRTKVIFLIVVLVIAGGFFLLGTDEVQAPSLEYPKGVSREEQVAYIMQEHIVHQVGDIFTDTAARFFIDVFLHPKRQYSPEMIMEKFFAYKLNEKPHFKPGEGYYYSDTNYVLLGLIIEQITGDSLPDQIRQRVLEPLEMHDTYFEFYEAETGSGKRLNSYQGRLNMTKHFSTSFEWGGGGLVSTTQDMATFIQALFGMELFEYESTLHLMLDNSENEADGASYARGINQYALDGDTYYEHGGHWGSLMMVNPEKDVVLSAHLAQAELPYDVKDPVRAILEIIEAR